MSRRSLAETHPQYLSSWGEENEIDPSTVVAGSDLIVIWVGECGHKWDMAIKQRVVRGYGCPYCANKRVLPGFNDLMTTHPGLAKELVKGPGGRDATQVQAGSKKHCLWRGACGHEWSETPKQRLIKLSDCPYCNNQKVLSGFNDLATRSKELLAKWDDVLNSVSPHEVLLIRTHKYWWRNDCNHSSFHSIDRQLSGYCSICRDMELASNSFATHFPHLLRYLDWDRTDHDPRRLSRDSGLKAWWKWECGHTDEVTFKNMASWKECTICSGRTIVPGVNDLPTRFPELMLEWDPSNTVEPVGRRPTERLRVKWICQKKKHKWTANIDSRTRGSGCGACARTVSSLEEAFSHVLSAFNLDFVRNTRPLHREGGRRYEIDFLLPELSLAFEIQDFATHSISSDFEPQQAWRTKYKKGPSTHEDKRDIAKRKLGVNLFDIWEDEITLDYSSNIVFTLLKDHHSQLLSSLAASAPGPEPSR